MGWNNGCIVGGGGGCVRGCVCEEDVSCVEDAKDGSPVPETDAWASLIVGGAFGAVETVAGVADPDTLGVGTDD